MTNVITYRCEECDTIFSSEEELIQQKSMQNIEDPVIAGSKVCDIFII
jgi:hypothetical protein